MTFPDLTTREALRAMCEIFDRPEWSDLAVDAYVFALDGFSEKQVVSALLAFLPVRNSIPTPLQLREQLTRWEAGPHQKGL